MESRRAGVSRRNTWGPIVCKRRGEANTFSVFGCETASKTASFTSPMAAVRIYGEASSEGDTRSHRIWSRRTDGVSWSTWPRIRNVIWRIEASGCALHNKGRTVVRGMMISGDISACGGDGAVQTTLRRIARVASSATSFCREAMTTGKREAKRGKV
jgi:hypothetical protein